MNSRIDILIGELTLARAVLTTNVTAHRDVPIHLMEVLANRWTVRDLISEAQPAAERRIETTKPVSVVGCLVGCS